MSEKVNKIKASQHESYTTFTLLSVILPIVGIILGVAYLTKDNQLDKKLGEHILALSILFMILWSIGWYVLAFNSAANQPVYTPIGY